MTQCDLDRCYWVRGEDGTTTLIPICWSRVHDPDADCTCGEWSEATARETIKGLKRQLYRMAHANQRLARAIKDGGLPDPTAGDWRMTPKDYTARRKRLEMHRRINGAESE